jgi:hypothetical protein
MLSLFHPPPSELIALVTKRQWFQGERERQLSLTPSWMVAGGRFRLPHRWVMITASLIHTAWSLFPIAVKTP